MFRISLPFTDWTVLLSPRWSELDSAGQIALLTVLALVPIALVLWLYRYDLRLARALKSRAEGGLPTGEQLDAWIAHYQAKGEASEPSSPDEARADGARRQQLADERRTVHDKLCAEVDKLTRAEVARRLLAS